LIKLTETIPTGTAALVVVPMEATRFEMGVYKIQEGIGGILGLDEIVMVVEGEVLLRIVSLVVRVVAEEEEQEQPFVRPPV
jgi:hypothetical protein